MAFRFPLATLLRLKEIAEQREERLLGQIEQQITQHRQMLADLALQREGVNRQREEALCDSTSAADLMSSHARAGAIRGLEASGREQLTKLEVLREQQIKIYQTAHRNSEVLIGMRDQQKDEFYKQQAKQEQGVMDDNFSSRRKHK